MRERAQGVCLSRALAKEPIQAAASQNPAAIGKDGIAVDLAQEEEVLPVLALVDDQRDGRPGTRSSVGTCASSSSMETNDPGITFPCQKNRNTEPDRRLREPAFLDWVSGTLRIAIAPSPRSSHSVSRERMPKLVIRTGTSQASADPIFTTSELTLEEVH